MKITVSKALWWLLLATLAVSYAIVVAGFFGAISPGIVSFGVLSGAMLGCAIAMAFLLSARRELNLR